jgi:hypothetical protein
MKIGNVLDRDRKAGREAETRSQLSRESVERRGFFGNGQTGNELKIGHRFTPDADFLPGLSAKTWQNPSIHPPDGLADCGTSLPPLGCGDRRTSKSSSFLGFAHVDR